MKKKILKNLVALVLTLSIMAPIFVVSLPALAGDLDPWGGKQDDIQSGTGLGDKDPRDIAASIINVIMGFLGIVAVVIILIGGFKYMTAAGNEEKTGQARSLIISGVIGLAIVLASFGIAKFVLDKLVGVTAE